MEALVLLTLAACIGWRKVRDLLGQNKEAQTRQETLEHFMRQMRHGDLKERLEELEQDIQELNTTAESVASERWRKQEQKQRREEQRERVLEEIQDLQDQIDRKREQLDRDKDKAEKRRKRNRHLSQWAIGVLGYGFVWDEYLRAAVFDMDWRTPLPYEAFLFICSLVGIYLATEFTLFLIRHYKPVPKATPEEVFEKYRRFSPREHTTQVRMNVEPCDQQEDRQRQSKAP